MTPVSDFRKMSLIQESQMTVTRSKSDTSYEGLASAIRGRRSRRASEWATGQDDKKMVLRPLQLNGDQKEIHSLLYRRLSRNSPKPNSSSEHTPKEGVTRSYSVKSMKKFSEARQRHRGSSIPSEGKHLGGVKVKERTVSNRSLPLPGDESEYLRLRNFSVTSKGVVNRGDSFRSKSSSNVPGLNTSEVEASVATEKSPSPVKDESKIVSSQEKSYKVLLLGSPGVGKTSIRKQFMTSEYICAYDFTSEQEIDRCVTVVLNNEESQMEFEAETFHDGIVQVLKADTLPDAFVIVYSVTDRKSFSQARQILSQVEVFVDSKAVILVGNKTDLARLRSVTTEEGKSLAKDRGCKFIETSVAINHQVDELLVGTLTQIRIKAKVADKLRKKRESQGSNRRASIYSASKASGVLKRILRRACLKSKSCDNLHVL